MSESGRKFWGWGVKEADLSQEQKKEEAQRMEGLFDLSGLTVDPPPTLKEIEIPEPKIKPPDSLSEICTTNKLERASHTYGKGFPDIVRAYERDFKIAPDIVAFPCTEQDIVDILDWCSREGVAAIPYGGGSSVVAGTEPQVGEGYKGTVTIDMKNLDKVLEIDQISRAANIQAGIYGPALEASLKPYKLTLRHFPQSFQFSTLGGWIATRSGGHYATLGTHIDEFVESVRMITPTGEIESFRLPGSGAGPSPDRFLIGSEGAMGIITSAWMRLQDRPTFRENAALVFPDFHSASEAVRAVLQAGLYPSNIRILDSNEAWFNKVHEGTEAVMVLGFESADHSLEAWMNRALECCMDHGGVVPDEEGDDTGAQDRNKQGIAGAWRDAFIGMPYVWEALVAMGMISETYESAITWERFPEFHETVITEMNKVMNEVCGGGFISCRFTYAYPDGPAPYYSITAPGKKGSQLEMGAELKNVISELFIKLGGTITHHHAVGRYHHKWYKKQRPELFGEVLKAAKHKLDPGGIMNPGVLVDLVR
ncbi:MAG: FAD-binding oxidoreductase [Deltaproteobacteria bacterium]|nr:FAD-binding oxidoreductase [Deltaproteobacteria bacterium]MCK5709609.1 FAD-binding oxidoreductase [Deltaproteobacteria bacterium]